MSTSSLVYRPTSGLAKSATVGIPENIKDLRKRARPPQPALAKKAGVSQQLISQLENGVNLTTKYLPQIAKALGVTMAEVDETFADQPGRAANSSIPDLEIFAGLGGGGEFEVWANGYDGVPSDPDQVRGYWQIPNYLVRRRGDLRNIYAWEVRGDSMEPTIFGGSVVFVDTSQSTPPPDDIYAVNFGDGLMVKRLKLVPRTDRVAVISDNERYGTDEFLREEVKIWGRVIGWFQWRGQGMLRFSIIGVAVLLAGCASVGTLTTSFDANQAAIINQQGKGSITGQAFLRRNDGVVVYAAGSEVGLIPKTAYADERMNQIYGGGKYTAFGKTFKNTDPAYETFIRKTVADGEGKFTFANVADGQYYLTTVVQWMAGNWPQGGALMERVTVVDGKPVNVIMTGQ